MQRIALQLEAWRCAERRRGVLSIGSPAWQVAGDEVVRAQTAYRAEARQAAVYHAELEFAANHHSFDLWRALVDRSPAANR